MCVVDNEQIDSVVSIPATSHICSLADFHNEIESEEDWGGKQQQNKEIAGNLYNLVCMIFFFLCYREIQILLCVYC